MKARPTLTIPCHVVHGSEDGRRVVVRMDLPHGPETYEFTAGEGRRRVLPAEAANRPTTEAP